MKRLFLAIAFAISLPVLISCYPDRKDSTLDMDQWPVVFEGWMFSNYIALHWYYKIYQLLARTDLISRYSPMDIIDFLQETRKIKIDGQWYLKEATAKTAKVLKKMGLNLK